MTHRRIAGLALVDARGWLLLQERDEHAPVDPDLWSLVGGQVEDGESDEEAAVRELEEETGLTGVDLLPLGELDFWCAGCREQHVLALFTAFTDLTDDDVECHEGRRIVFVDPTTIDSLPWNRGLAVALPRVLGHPSYGERFGRREPRGFGCVLLVNADGDVLLQERDEHAPIDPDRWGLCGGHLEPGEDPEDGAYREVEEETGVRLEPGTLEPFTVVDVFHPHYGSVDHVHVYAGPADLTDADIDCREGRQIVFVSPDRARGLDLTMTAVLCVPAFLDSDAYLRLTAAQRGAVSEPPFPRSGRWLTHRRPEAASARHTDPMNIEVIPVPGAGAEDVVVAPSGPDEGSVFTGTEDGAIWRISHDGQRIAKVADTGGRPLGIEIDLDGRLLVCDARAGVLRIDTRTGSVERVVAEVAGVPMAFCNNAAIAGDGTVWFTDSSAHYGIDHWRDDFVQDTRTGRLLRLDPSGEVEVVIEGLAFANGVALAADESYVAVAETAARTVVRRWLAGPRAGERDLLATDLPGYPDNIARGSDGLIWVSIASPRDPLVERLQRGPMPLRRAVTRIPMWMQPQPKRTVRALAFDDDGRVVHDVDLPADGYHMVTGVREHDGRLWLGSLHEPAVAVVTL